MKYFIRICLLLTFALTGCKGESRVSDMEYEFLTPNMVVMKGNNRNPADVISTQYRADRIWLKENGLLRNKRGKILREADITCYQYFVLDKPFTPGEKRIIGTKQVQYDPGKPTRIFKLNQLGNGVTQQKKYAYMGAWLGNSGALPLKHFSGENFVLMIKQSLPEH